MLKDCKITGDNISYEVYHRQSAKRGDKDFSMSRSELIAVATCAEKWIDGYGIEEESTASTEWGQMLDCLMTQSKRFDDLFSVCPETYPDSKTGEPKPFIMSSKWCKEWVAGQTGKIIIKADRRKEADIAVRALNSDDTVAELFKTSRKQVMVTGFWYDEETDLRIPVRALLDLVPVKTHKQFGKWLVDFKTARNGNPAQWARVVDDSAYDLQAALYLDLYVAATHEDRTDWTFIVQENEPPYHVVNPLPSLTEEFLVWGRVKYQDALRLYARCLKTGEWPSYPTGDRMVIFGLQKISPEGLWTYKQTAGQSTLQSREEYKPKPTP